ncbi:MAG: tetratricopeptide repeat protein, partial [Leptospira sp.]|nr:tetratricopeptide repeat protein [Leptospira sp.]
MKLMLYYICIFLFSGLSLPAVTKGDKVVYAFRDTSSHHIKMIVIGETVSIEKASCLESEKNCLLGDKLGVDTSLDNVTVTVHNSSGLKIGQTLYLLEKNPDHKSYRDGNIVGEIKVQSIFNTTFFGLQLRGDGYLRLIENKPMTVARLMESENIEEAALFKKQGDYFVAKGDVPTAIKNYKKSISLD